MTMLDVACALVVKNSKILAVQRGRESHHPMKWEFPGGKIKTGETAEECIVREIEEEINLHIEVIFKLQQIEHDYGIKQINLIPLICQITSGTIQLLEHLDLWWLSFDELDLLDWCEADAQLIKRNREDIKIFLLKKY